MTIDEYWVKSVKAVSLVERDGRIMHNALQVEESWANTDKFEPMTDSLVLVRDDVYS